MLMFFSGVIPIYKQEKICFTKIILINIQVKNEMNTNNKMRMRWILLANKLKDVITGKTEKMDFTGPKSIREWSYLNIEFT